MATCLINDLEMLSAIPAATPQIKGCNGRERPHTHISLVLCSKAQVCLHATPLAGPSLLGHANHSLLEHDSNREYEDHVEISGRQLCLDSRTREDMRECPYLLLLRIIANELMTDGCDGCDWVTLYKTTTQEPKHHLCSRRTSSSHS